MTSALSVERGATGPMSAESMVAVEAVTEIETEIETEDTIVVKEEDMMLKVAEGT